jgi:hypothetical protein
LYKVISAVRDSFFDNSNAAMTGTEQDEFKDLDKQVLEKILAHQRKLYGSDIEEYKP